jgi:hypothetical protein
MKKLKDILMDDKFLKTCSRVFLSIFAILFVALFVVYFIDKENEEPDTSTTPEGLMLLIEFEDTVGLNNFVYQMYERDIPGLLVVNADFVEENCDFIKGLQDYNIEIGGTTTTGPFWDMPYSEQYEVIKETKNKIEACTEKSIRTISSGYFAYDENTLKIAEELGIEYVLARGTTGPKATIYKPEEYDVKIFSVSNIDSPKWGTGSLCDYSYWAREGNPEDFRDEVYNAFETYNKVSPVSHTYIGGAKARWNDVYIDMFNNLEVNWISLNEFGEIDVYDSFSNIPDNREVQYTTPKPEIPLDEEVNVNNPCAVIESSEEVLNNSNIDKNELVMFHNGSGPMCLEAIDFFEENDMEYIEYLTTDEDFQDKLNLYMEEYDNQSEGISTSFGYYPMIFFKDKAFSGFNESIGMTLKNL